MVLPADRLLLDEGHISWQSASGCHSCGSWRALPAPDMKRSDTFIQSFPLSVHISLQDINSIKLRLCLENNNLWINCLSKATQTLEMWSFRMTSRDVVVCCGFPDITHRAELDSSDWVSQLVQWRRPAHNSHHVGYNHQDTPCYPRLGWQTDLEGGEQSR